MTDQVPSKDLLSRCLEVAQEKLDDARNTLDSYRGYPTRERRYAARVEEIETLILDIKRATAESKPAHEREPPHCSSCACGIQRYDDKRDLASIIAHLRHGDADGQDHDDAADALERLERDNARLEELLRLAEGLSVPGRVQIIEFVHWNEDPLIPYEGCNCPACADARTLVKTDTSDGTAKPPGDVPENIAVGMHTEGTITTGNASGPSGPPPVALSAYCPACGHPMYEHQGSPTPGGIVWCPQK